MFASPPLGWYWIVSSPHTTQGVFGWTSRRRWQIGSDSAGDDVSHCRDTLRDYERKRPESLPIILSSIREARAAMDVAPCVAPSDPRLQ